MISLRFLVDNIIFLVPLFVVVPSLAVLCNSKKKFETDARANLVPRNAVSPASSKKSSEKVTARPTAQTPPLRTPLEKSNRNEEDTLANVVSLQPESSDGPNNKKEKKK
ncbi:unnamed protein product [Caenorhabditis sp. 36 PRJEB53466]|nr:unnamed protein product [Caenorhabditis sp. 36 PRJEB53466]